MTDIKALIADLRKTLDHADDLVREIERRDIASDLAWQQGAAVAPTEPPPPPYPVQPPAPVVTPPPAPPTERLNTHYVSNVFATVWRNAADEAPGGDPPRSSSGHLFQPGEGKTIAAVALPVPFKKWRSCRVRRSEPRGQWTTWLPQMDTGPWNINDPYWLIAGGRPQAETGTDTRGRKTNRAGIDLTPLAMSMVTGLSARQIWDDPVSLLVDIEVIEPPVEPDKLPTPTPKLSPVEKAQLSRLDPCTYELGEELPGPKSDCSGAVGYWLGYSRDERGWNTDAIHRMATAGEHGWSKVLVPLPGDVLVYPSGNGREYGHVGLITQVADGKAVKVVHCSHSHTAGKAVQETGPEIFVARNAIIARYKGD